MEKSFVPYLANPTRTLAVLEKYGFTFKKQYGQNFLIDSNILESIIFGANISDKDTVLEIGPGIGTLTQYLSVSSLDVVAVEIDKRLIEVLNDTLRECKNVTIVNSDILKTDIEKIIRDRKEKTLEETGAKSSDGFHVVANLPYYITTPIVMSLLESGLNVKSITVMVQSEVADRMKAGPGSKDYGVLSLAVQYFSDPKIVLEVSPNSFIPRPKVGSTVISLKKLDSPRVNVKNPNFMFKVIKGAFSLRRKTLVNSLSHYGLNGCDKESILDALIEMGLDERIRGEALSLEQFAKLSDLLFKE